VPVDPSNALLIAEKPNSLLAEATEILARTRVARLFGGLGPGRLN
jgi:hypothetical protein